MSDIEAGYLLTRAKEEAEAATQAHHPSASAAHQQLSMLYSAKAILELASDPEERQTSDPKQHP